MPRRNVYRAPLGRWTNCHDRDADLIGIVIVTNGNLGREMLANVEQIVGEQLSAVTIAVTDNEYRRINSRICDAVKEVDTGGGVIIMTDVQGSSSFNLCKSACSGSGHVIISGLNMPMLIKLAKIRDRRLQEAARIVADSGRKYINIVD